jgi:signal transduction histidine kinase
MRLRGRDVDVLTAADGLSNDYTDALFEDREGSLWVGTELDGVNQLRDGAITTYSKAEGLPAETVWSVMDDGRGTVWIGTEKGLALLRHGRLTPLESPVPSQTICTILQAPDGTIWIGTYDQGLFGLHDGRWSHFTRREGLPNDEVTALEVDGNTLWIGTADGLARMSGGRMTTLPRDGFPSTYITLLHRDQRRRMWAGTWKGLALLDDRGIATQKFGGKTLPQDPAYCMHEDRDGAIWTGTPSGLLHISATDHVSVLTTRDGLPTDDISHVEQDQAGDFWLSCVKGIVRVSKQELERGKITSALILDSADGMKRDSECTGGTQDGSYASHAGSIWFATTRGVSRVDPMLAGRWHSPPPVRIEEMIADGKRQAAGERIELSSGTEQLEFHYTAPSFRAPDRIRFRYQLIGYDRDWIDAGTRRAAYYAHVPPGTYRFRVAAYVNPWVQLQSGAELAFALRPAFSQTIWFQVLWTVAAALLALAIYLMRVRNIRAKYAAVLAERNRIAREFHDTLAQSLVALGFQLDAVIDSIGDSGKLPEARRAIDGARKLARQCLSETRRSLLDMRPEVLERADLVSAVGAVAAQAREASGIAVSAEIIGEARRLDSRVEQHMLRIAQEGLTNAVRHAGAQKITVALRFDDDLVELSIIDDGSGPRSMADSGPLRLGILGIRERAAEVGGRLSVSSRAGEGTTISLIVPSGERPTLATRILAWSGWR